jgi:hypothetical protein
MDLMLLSTKKTGLAPLLMLSMPSEPEPEKRSSTQEFSHLLPKTLNMLSLTLSCVGLIS